MWPSGLDEESSPLQPIDSQKLQSLTTSQKQIKKAYHTHSSFLTKHHIDGIVAMLDVSNVDNVCVCLKMSDQFALETGAFTDGSPHLPYKVTLGLLKGWPYKKLSTCIQFTKYIF